MSGAVFAAGARVGPYEVLGLLGGGGMGEVALKVLHAEVSSDPSRVRRFEQEARAAGMLNHPNIVAVYDTGDGAGSPYIVSELLQGEALRERLIGGGLAVHKALDYGIVFAAAEKGSATRLYVQDVAGGKPERVAEEGVSLVPLGRPISPDRAWILAIGPDGVPALYPLAGGAPRVIPGLGYFDRAVSWSSDGRELFVLRYDESPLRVDRVEVATGRARPWTRMAHSLSTNDGSSDPCC